ncbi:MAG: tetratricopeptide repeat protein [Armatimonadetes bacterium]|nr:tetratricopeptide repeat protein [Armatimonadota bacterium]
MITLSGTGHPGKVFINRKVAGCGLLLLVLLAAVVAPASGDAAGRARERAVKAYDRADYRRAASLLGNHLKSNPRDAEAHYLMGLTQSRLKNRPLALRHLFEAHRLKPRQKQPVQEYGKVLEAHTFDLAGQQRFDEALAGVDEAARRFPDENWPFFARGLALFERWRHQRDPADHLQALALWKNYCDLESLSATADIVNGIADFEGHNYEAALSKFDSAAIREPNNPYAPMWRGLAHAALQQYEPAEDHLTRALDAFGTNASLYRYLGDVKALGGSLEEAESFYQKALGLKPGDPAALEHLALVCEARGKLEQAIGTYRDLITLRPADFDVLLQMVRLYRRAGKPDLALSTLRKAEEAFGTGTDNPKILEERRALLVLETGLTFLQRRDRAAAGEKALILIRDGKHRFLPDSARPRYLLFRGQVGTYDERERSLQETLQLAGPEADELRVDAYIAYGDLRLQQEQVKGADGKLRDRYVDAIECYYQAWRRVPANSPKCDVIAGRFADARQRKIEALEDSIPVYYLLFGRARGQAREAHARAAIARLQALQLPAAGELWRPQPGRVSLGMITPDELQGELSQNVRTVMASTPAMGTALNLRSGWLPAVGAVSEAALPAPQPAPDEGASP